mgnify:FL=1
MTLIYFVGFQGSITNDFTRDTQVMWMGEENALKVPKTTISLKSDSWQLMGYEDSTLKCELFDGVRPLNSDTLPVARDGEIILRLIFDSHSQTDNLLMSIDHTFQSHQ